MTELAITIDDGASPADVALSYDESEPCSNLIEAISAHLAVGPRGRVLRVERTGVTLLPTMRAGDVGLLYGDVVQLVPQDRPAGPYLQRIGKFGPARIDVSIGTTTLGRASASGVIGLGDPTVSRPHAALECTAGRVTVRDLGSRNGTFVNGVRLTGEQVLAAGDCVEVGEETLYRLVAPTGSQPPAPHLRPSGGRLVFNRPPRHLIGQPGATLEIGPAPEEARSRRFPLPLVILPLVLGAVVALATGSLAFLAFGLLGPVMALWNWWDDRRSGRRDLDAATKRYHGQLEATAATATQLASDTAQWRTWALPPMSALSERARSRAPLLWDRQPQHTDFLDVRVGTGDLPAPYRVAVSEQGSAALVAEARRLRDHFAIDHRAPVGVALQRDRIVGIAGGSDETRSAVGRAALVQLAVRTSPNDVRLAVLGETEWAWMRWLPHSRPSDAAVALVGTDPPTVERLLQYVEHRVEQARLGPDRAPRTDLVLLVDAPDDLDPMRVNAVLAAAAEARISVVWLATEAERLPGRCTVVVDLGPPAILRRTTGEAPVVLSELESITVAEAAIVARSLAPLVDPGSARAGAVPERVGLVDLLGPQCLQPERLVDSWRHAEGDRLVAAVGVGADGPVLLDLGNEGDGPHGLVAGSPGSGKSEFLQTLVVSLAAGYSPDELTFLFIDFKGGLTFRDLVRLPHAVGMVRNLDGALGLRAKRSLQAELRRRQLILHEHGAVNLADLRGRAPDVQLPALVMIIDEYAELADKLPEFLEGVVEVAQTGRALGMHLLLATQSPGQSVSRSIQNCAKYRVGFRLEQSAESFEVLGRGRDASQLPNHPGRGIVRRGDGTLHDFQAAWAGGRTSASAEPRASARPLQQADRTPTAAAEGPTDLVRVIESIGRAADLAGIATPRRPWLEPLPAVLPMSELFGEPGVVAGHRAMLGRIDLPDEQRQPSYEWDLGRVLNLLVIGDGASGKTTTLRTIAAAFSHACDSNAVQLLGIDASGGGLASIDALPNTVGVVSTSDATRLRRAIAYLQRLVGTRRQLVGKAGSLRTYRASSGAAVPDVIVLVDGLEHLLSALELLDAGAHLSGLTQLIADGPGMGVHFALATDQPQRVPMSIANAVPERLVLRMASRDASHAAGVGRALDDLPIGRAISTRSNAEVQIAVLSDGPDLDGLAQARALEQLGHELRAASRTNAPPFPEPPASLRPSSTPAVDLGPGQVVLGIDDVFGEPLVVDFAITPTLVVMGPELSGRTSTVDWVRQALDLQSPLPLESVLIDGQWSGHAARPGWLTVATDLTAAVEVVERLAASPPATAAGAGPTRLLVIDDGDDLLEAPIGAPVEEAQLHRRFATAMDALVRGGRTSGLVIVLAGRLNALTRATGWAQRLRQSQQAVILAPASLAISLTDPVFNVQLPRRSDFVPQPGRGVLIRRGRTDVIQVVQP